MLSKKSMVGLLPRRIPFAAKLTQPTGEGKARHPETLERIGTQLNWNLS